ncbi:MAG: heme-binding domain-containing protein [Bacteroidota bacterium]
MDDVLATRTMPLSSYKLVHPEARLTEEQVRRLQAWIQSLRESIPKDR